MDVTISNQDESCRYCKVCGNCHYCNDTGDCPGDTGDEPWRYTPGGHLLPGAIAWVYAPKKAELQ